MSYFLWFFVYNLPFYLYQSKCYDISPAELLNHNQCPPREVMLEDERKGAIESQRANSGLTCVMTVFTSNTSQVILFTFMHIPPAIAIHIFDSEDLYNPLSNCDIENGKQCYSTGPRITFQFIADSAHTNSIAPVELFLVPTTLEHARKLVAGNSSGLRTWQVWAIVGGVFLSLLAIGMLLLLFIICRRRKREKEQLKTMQTCMIYAHPRVRTIDNY